MAKLPKNIIKKYGISKKAWRIYRNSQRKRTSQSRHKRAKKIRGGKMTKRKQSISPLLKDTAYSFGYGVFRNAAARTAQKYLGNNMAGKYADNVILGGIGTAAALFGSGLIRKAGKKMLEGEAFLAGIKTGSSFGVHTSTPNNSF